MPTSSTASRTKVRPVNWRVGMCRDPAQLPPVVASLMPSSLVPSSHDKKVRPKRSHIPNNVPTKNTHIEPNATLYDEKIVVNDVASLSVDKTTDSIRRGQILIPQCCLINVEQLANQLNELFAAQNSNSGQLLSCRTTTHASVEAFPKQDEQSSVTVTRVCNPVNRCGFSVKNVHHLYPTNADVEARLQQDVQLRSALDRIQNLVIFGDVDVEVDAKVPKKSSFNEPAARSNRKRKQILVTRNSIAGMGDEEVAFLQATGVLNTINDALAVLGTMVPSTAMPLKCSDAIGASANDNQQTKTEENIQETIDFFGMFAAAVTPSGSSVVSSYQRSLAIDRVVALQHDFHAKQKLANIDKLRAELAELVAERTKAELRYDASVRDEGEKERHHQSVKMQIDGSPSAFHQLRDRVLDLELANKVLQEECNQLSENVAMQRLAAERTVKTLKEAVILAKDWDQRWKNAVEAANEQSGFAWKPLVPTPAATITRARFELSAALEALVPHQKKRNGSPMSPHRLKANAAEPDSRIVCHWADTNPFVAADVGDKIEIALNKLDSMILSANCT